MGGREFRLSPFFIEAPFIVERERSEALYREAVPSQSPGLPLRLPWVDGVSIIQPQRGCGRCRNPFRVDQN